MKKVEISKKTMIYPIPAVMVSCGNLPENYNIITIGWTGTICSNPPMCYISVRKSRFSHKIISDTGEFVINLTTKSLVYEADWCGIKSGKSHNKFNELGLTPVKASMLSCPVIMESPVNIECKVQKVLELGSHDMFIADVLTVCVSENLIDPDTGKLNLNEAELISYINGDYYNLGELIGKSGFSVK